MNDHLKKALSSSQRTLPLTLYIDPGFVHHRKIETILGQKGIDLINEMISKISPQVPEWQKPIQIDHIYTRIFLTWAAHARIKTLPEMLSDRNGHAFLSVVKVGKCLHDIYRDEMVQNEILLNENNDAKVILEYSAKKVSGDTLRSSLSLGSDHIAVIAELSKRNKQENTLVFNPLIMGFPWLEGDADFSPEWFGTEYYEVFIADIDEFSKVRGLQLNDNEWLIMKDISENAFKRCLTEILNDSTKKDWGGESSDHFTAHLHLNGRQVTGAFLLKGPARFQPMKLNTLGKNNDQINRLAKEPAQLLFVQHCHDIEPPVRETLRAFAVQPGRARNYCLIDGRDSYLLLKAYGKVDQALSYSKGLKEDGQVRVEPNKK